MKRKILSCFLALGLVMFFAGLARGIPLNYTAALNSMQVVKPDNSPANNSSGRGSCKVEVKDFWEMMGAGGMDVTCEFSGLSSAIIDADIRLAPVGQNGVGICTASKNAVVTLPNNGNGTISISCWS